LRGHASAVRTGEVLRDSRQIAHETEQLGHEIMSDLTQQRETLLRTQDKVFSFSLLYFECVFCLFSS